MRKLALTWIRDGDCIRSTSHKSDLGYVHIRRGGGKERISRIILEKRLGVIPNGIIARHTCDNSWCINPGHIISGTQADNTRDARERGRWTHGEIHGAAKLNESQVIQILSRRGESRLKLAKEFCVSRDLIRRIECNEVWRHIPR